VVLMDIRMPGLDGVAATRRIRADPRLAAVAVLVLTTFDADEHVFDAIRAGARGFLLKDTDPDELRRAVRVVAAGESLLSPAVTERVMRAAVRGSPSIGASDRLRQLTQREREVLAELARGNRAQAVAEQYVVSLATVRTQIRSVLSKLEVGSQLEAVALYRRGQSG